MVHVWECRKDHGFRGALDKRWLGAIMKDEDATVGECTGYVAHDRHFDEGPKWDDLPAMTKLIASADTGCATFGKALAKAGGLPVLVGEE
jgi:hypothetical protein